MNRCLLRTLILFKCLLAQGDTRGYRIAVVTREPCLSNRCDRLLSQTITTAVIVVEDDMTFYYFGVEIEVVVEPHNKKQPVPAPVSQHLDLWYDKIAKAMRNRNGCDQRPLKAIAEPRRTEYRGRTDRHTYWWITWDGSLISPSWPKHPGGKSNFYGFSR